MAYVRDLSDRARLELTGPDRVRFLHGMITNDVEALAPGAGARAAMLSVKGKTLAELVVYADEDRLLLELDGSLRQKIREVLEKHLVMDDVEVADRTDELREIGVFGPDARAAIGQALGTELPELAPYHHVQVRGVRVAASPELGLPGYHLMAPELPLVAGEPLDEAGWERLRIEAGRPRWGRELDEDRLILEAGLEDAVSHSKGCYLGQEVVARATSRGHINRRLMGLTLDGTEPVAPGARLSVPGREDAGLVTSSAVSPAFGAIALAYVHKSAWEPGTQVTVHAPSGDRPARVTALPFSR